MNKKWRCTICAYAREGETPPDKCPVCGAGKLKFKEAAVSKKSSRGKK